jgi:hypothetical protein
LVRLFSGGGPSVTGPRQTAEFGDAVDEAGHTPPKLPLDLNRLDGRVLDHVVQKGAGDRLGVELHPARMVATAIG